MRLKETILKCYECQKTTTYEVVKIVNRGGKKYWVCPHCDFETPFVEKKSRSERRLKRAPGPR
jgi:protein-arginine kinase activator protein McsA